MDTIEELKKMRSNAIRLIIEGETEYIIGGTRFGGVPDMPAGFEWPWYETATSEDDEIKPRSLAFLAQFNCSELVQFDQENLLPKTGLLLFFYEIKSECWGYDPNDQDSFRVLWFENTDRLSPAKIPDNLADDYRLPMLKITMNSEVSYPSVEDFTESQSNATNMRGDCADALSALVGESSENCSKLLGWANVIQNSMQAECELVSQGYDVGHNWGKIPGDVMQNAQVSAIKDWRLLFQLDTVEHEDFELMFGDCGRLYFFIRKEDLARQCFDRVWMISQCY